MRADFCTCERPLMTDMMNTIKRLATEIGPRPAATEEEQQAALFIADELEAAGLPAEIEEFQGAVSRKKTRLVCSALAVIVALVSLFASVLALPAVIIAVVCAALFTAEEMGKPILSKILDKGISQNVIARYVPAPAQNSGSSRRRKVVLVARTDSGTVQPELNGGLLSAMPILAKASRIGMIALPILLLLKALFFLHSTGVVFVITTVLLVLVCICAALPAISFILSKAGGLNDGANSSASGVAVMLEVARRVNGGDIEAQPVVHGARAAYEADLVPEGAQLVYENAAGAAFGDAFADSPEETLANQPAAPDERNIAEDSEAGRLLAAKAAIAAMTGKPVSETVSLDFNQPASEDVAQQKVAPAGAVVAGAAAAVPAAIAVGAAAGFTVDAAAGEIVNTAETVESLVESGRPQEMPLPEETPVFAPAKKEIPSWFSAGRAAARRTEEPVDTAAFRRNSHAAALEAAEQRLNALAQVEEESIVAPSAEERLQQLQEVAQNVQAPQYDRELVAAVEPEPETLAQEATLPAQAQPVEQAPVDRPFIAMTDFAVSPLVKEEPEAVQEQPIQDRVIAPTVVTTSVASEVELPAIDSFADEIEEVEAPVEEPVVAEPAPVSLDYFMAAAMGGAAGDTVIIQPVSAETRQELVLPDLSATGTIPVVDLQKQRAPLAEAAESGQSAARSLLTMLPSIDPEAPEQPDLRASLPSLSGAFMRVPSPNSPSLSLQFEPIAGATGSFAPVAEALAMDVEDDEDLFIDDADDSDFEENYTETGAFAGPEYVDMPKQRGLGIFDKLFSRNKKEDDIVPSGWADDDYATPASASQSGWEDAYEEDEYAYEDDEYEYEDDYEYEYEDDDYDDEEWEGGAFSGKLSGVASRVRGAIPAGKGGNKEPRGHGRGRGAQEEMPYEQDEYVDQEPVDDRASRRAARRSEQDELARVYQMIASRYEASAEGAAEAVTPDYSMDSAALNDDAQQQISAFRASGIDTEVWFVALGAETDCHAGITNFIEEHQQELRGAVIVELDSLGAGVLTSVTKEGILRPTSASSRMRRYITRASQSSGVPVETASILWGESAASTALHKGVQAMHLAGMDGAKPALYAQADDVAENIDPEILAENANFVVEILKNI